MLIQIANSPINWKRVQDSEDLKTELRIRSKTDLLFLAHDVLGYADINEEDHREIADFFVKKDPFKTTPEQDTVFKLRMLILPRRTYKTTFNICDCIQWVLVDPEIAIMVMTASNSPDSPLADAFVQEISSHFYRGPQTNPTRLHTLFPEHTITRFPKAGIFYTPARKKYRRDPTVKAVSIEQSLSGWHPDIIKSEDVQDNRNSQTAAALRKVRTNFYINLKMLPNWGYVDLTATRYGPNDLYAHMLANRGKRTKLLWKPAYYRKLGADPELDDDELTEDDVVLNFPKQLPWDFLREVKGEDPGSFWTQYMNVAEGSFVPTFPQEMLNKRKLADDNIPYHGEVFIVWRLEYAECVNSAALVGLLWNGRITVVDAVRGSFKPTVLARKVVALAQKWETHRVEIEDTPGARDYENHIHNEAIEQRWKTDIQWGEFVRDPSVRDSAVKAIEPHLAAGRLLFAENLPNDREVQRQMYQFGIIEEKEIPILVSRLTARLPNTIASEEFEANDEAAWADLMRQDAYFRMFGPETPPVEASEVEEDEPEFVPAENLYALDEAMPGLSG